MFRVRAPLLAFGTTCTLAAAGVAASPSWTRQPDLPVARSAHAVVAAADAIYVLGGTGPEGQPVMDVHRFDGRVWTREGQLPGEGLNSPAAAAVGDSIYLIGGFGSTSNRPVPAVYRYDVPTKAWTKAAPLPAPRGGHAAVALDGRIHVIGGGNSQSTIDDHSVYDPRTDTWADKAPLPRRMGSPAAVVLDRRLYSIGGRSGLEDFPDVHSYDPAADAWRPGPAIDARGTGGAAVLGGAIYYFGGESQASERVLPDVLRMRPREGRWERVGDLPTPRSYARAVTFRDAIYVVGGSTRFGSSHASRGSAAVERFKP